MKHLRNITVAMIAALCLSLSGMPSLHGAKKIPNEVLTLLKPVENHLPFKLDDLKISYEQSKKFTPFPGIPVTINGLTFKLDADVKQLLGYGSSEKKRTGLNALVIGGSATIMNLPLEVFLSFEKTASGKVDVVLMAKMPSKWKISDSISAAKRTPLDELQFENLLVVVTNKNGTKVNIGGSSNPHLNMTINKGIGFGGTLRVTGPINVLVKLLGMKTAHVGCYAAVGTKLSDFFLTASLGAKLPFKGKIAKKLQSGSLDLTITGRPSFIIGGNMTVTPSDKDAPLEFTAQGEITPLELKLSGSMAGMWNNPLGIKKLSIGDLGLEVDIIYEQFIASGIPSGAGLTGKIAIGDSSAGGGLKISENPKDELFFANARNLTLYNIAKWVKIPSAVRKTIPKKFGLDYADIRIAPFGGKIGTIPVDKGTTAAGKVTLGPATGEASLNVDLAGIQFSFDFEQNILSELNKVIQGKDTKKKSQGPHFKPVHLASNVTYNLMPQAVTDTKPMLLAFSLSGSIKSAADKVKGTVESGIDKVTDTVKTASGAIASGAKQIGNLVKKGTKWVIHGVEYGTEFLFDEIKDLSKKAIEALTKNFDIRKLGISAGAKEVKLRLEAKILGKTYNFDFGVDLLDKPTELIKKITSEVIKKIKKLV